MSVDGYSGSYRSTPVTAPPVIQEVLRRYLDVIGPSRHQSTQNHFVRLIRAKLENREWKMYKYCFNCASQLWLQTVYRNLTVLAVSGLPQWNLTVYFRRKLTGSGQVGGGAHWTDSFLPGITITLTFTGGSGFTTTHHRRELKHSFMAEASRCEHW